jgi:hypothetical protein
MHLMQERFATVQISALGYPPTTGLSTIDYKVLDPHILTPNHARYYSETPLVLPSSFWCFDPMTEGLDVAEEPPQFKNGYVTFYSVGNISKINERMLLTWKRIMDRLPTSRLQIRSISFDDDQTQKDFAQRLRSHGFEMGRVSLLKSAIALDLFLSYNEVDIVLDTFPFNGGTTTAFAMHMGTPVITLAGASLVSRMGASAMANMEAAEWICHTFGEYEEKAIVMAANKPFLKEFKQNARGRLNACSMGNGRLYARDFEAACMQALKAQMDEPAIKVCSIAPLPLQELSKRAYATLSNNLIDATRRIQRLISRDYPDSYVVSMLTAQLEIEAGDIEGALERLRMRIDSLDAPGQAAAGLFAAAWYQRGGRIQDMNEVLAVLEPTAIDNNLDRAQFNLFKVCAEQAEDGPLTTGSHYVEPSAQKWVFILVCASEIVYESRRAALMHLWDAWTGLAEAEFVWASRMSRAQTYSAALGREEVDVVVILDETAMPHAPDFPQRINSVLGEHDVVGFFGSSVWHRSMWRYETFDAKVGSYMCKPAPEAEVAELRWFGVAKNSMHPKLAVLDGRLLALRPGSVLGLCPNPAYQGTESLMEEEWVYRAGRQGARLGVAPALGVWLDAPSVSDRTEKVEVFLQLTAEHEFQVFSERPDDAYSANLLITSKAQGLDLQRRITERS